MQITDIRIRKIAKEGKMKAVVSVTFDNAFVVHDIKVIVIPTVSTTVMSRPASSISWPMAYPCRARLAHPLR